MADESPINHGNNVEVNHGTINQYISHQLPPKPLRERPQLRRVALVGGLAAALLGTWGLYAPNKAHSAAKKAYYCASGGHVKYHATPDCAGLSSCSARVVASTVGWVKKQEMAPCLVCHSR